MRPNELSGPDLAGVVADADAAGLDYVVIGGFSVIYHCYVRATKDSDLLVPGGAEANAAVIRFLERADARRLRDDRAVTIDDVAEAHHLRRAGGETRAGSAPADRMSAPAIRPLRGSDRPRLPPRAPGGR